MTVEEAYLLASFLTELSPKVTLALGPVRVEGEDDKYPKDVHGRPVEPAKFTIRAEKARIAAAWKLVLQHFTQIVATIGDVLGRAAGEFRRCIWSAAIRRVGSRTSRPRRSIKLAP